jgi:hypothetical protein
MEQRITKNAIIARSGVYEYSRRELEGLGLFPVPKAYDGVDVFKVYRPAAVLMANHQKFSKLPIQREHNAWLTPDNYRDFAIGWTGDSCEMAYDKEKDEVVIKSTVNLLDAEGLIAYDSGITEVSPAYDGHWTWQEGEYNGKKYQIVMDSITKANHLALTVQARGGRDVRIFDSRCTMKEKGSLKKYLSGLWHSAKKKAKGATDSDLGQFRAKVDGLIAERGKLDDAGVKADVEELKGFMTDLPDSDEKGTLERVLEDFGVGLKDQDDATAKQAGDMVADLYEKLEGDAVADVEPAADGAPAADKPAEPKPEDKPAEPPAKDGAPAGGSGADPTTPETPTDKKPEDGAPAAEAPAAEPDGDEPLSAGEVKALRAILAQAGAAGAGDGCGGKTGDAKPDDTKPKDNLAGDGKADDSAGAFKTSVASATAAKGLVEFIDTNFFGRRK